MPTALVTTVTPAMSSLVTHWHAILATLRLEMRLLLRSWPLRALLVLWVAMIGIEAQAHPAVAREVAAAGHLIVNHTWTHLNLAWLPPAVVTEQMSRATNAIHAATGQVPALFRAPYGAWSPFVLSQCARTGMAPLGWSVDPRDWSRPGVTAIVANIMRNTRSGSIILEHDGGGNRSQTVAALKIVIPRLLAAGYHFRTP